jgi:hypothetical protein
MDPMLKIPKDRKRIPVLRLCLLMGLTALLFLMIASSLSGAFEVLQPPPVQ